MSFVSHLECSRCGETRSHREIAGLCVCGGPFLVRYHLDAVGRAVRPGDLAGREDTLWRYRELLPVEDPARAVTLGEGWTPLLALPELGRDLRLPHLVVMDEGANPTGTFKDRGAAVGISRARELGVTELAIATAGNAGGAWSAYGRRAGLRVHVAMPQDAPRPNRLECAALAASLHLVEGLISDAGKLVAGWVAERGWFDACTLKEPYRIEGKKTMGLEIAERYDWGAPDAILYPTGGGVGIIGIAKAYRELRALGWTRAMPRLVAVQSSGCAPIVRAFAEGDGESRFWERAATLASGLRVPKALGDRLVLAAVRESGGTAVEVTDAEILEAMERAARAEGFLPCPEGAATVAAAAALRREGFLAEDHRVLLLNTGTAQKYPEALDEVARRRGG